MTAEITTGIPDTAFTCEQTQMGTHCMRVSKMSRTWMSCHEEGLGTWEALDWERDYRGTKRSCITIYRSDIESVSNLTLLDPQRINISELKFQRYRNIFILLTLLREINKCLAVKVPKDFLGYSREWSCRKSMCDQII